MKVLLRACVGIIVGVGFLSACVGDDSTTPSDGGNDVTTAHSGGSDVATTETGTTCDGGQICSGTCINTSGDPNNCGGCAHSCGTGQCASGVCQPTLIVGDPNGDGGTVITSLTTDQGDDNPQGAAQHIFWGETTTAGGVFQDNVLGGNTIMLSTSPVTTLTNVVVNGANVFWFAYNTVGVQQPILQGQVGVAGSQTSFSTINGTEIQSLLFDATNSTVCGSLTANGTQYSVFKCPTSTKTCTAVSTSTGVVQGNVATDATKLYVADSDDGVIESVTLGAASNTSTLVQNQATPTLIRVDSTFLYWFDSGTKNIERQGLSSTVTKQLATTNDAITGLAADAVNVYWADPTSGEVAYAPITGAGPNTSYVTSLGASTSPMRLVRDAGFLYFSHNAAIYRVALP